MKDACCIVIIYNTMQFAIKNLFSHKHLPPNLFKLFKTLMNPVVVDTENQQYRFMTSEFDNENMYPSVSNPLNNYQNSKKIHGFCHSRLRGAMQNLVLELLQ